MRQIRKEVIFIKKEFKLEVKGLTLFFISVSSIASLFYTNTGWVGKVLNVGLYKLFGNLAFVPCVMFIVYSVFILKRKTKRSIKQYGRKLFFSLMTFFSFSGMLSVVDYDAGHIGKFFGGVLLLLFGEYISLLLLSLLCIFTLSFVLDIPIYKMKSKISNFIFDFDDNTAALKNPNINFSDNIILPEKEIGTSETRKKIDFKIVANTQTFYDKSKLSVPIGINADGVIRYEDISEMPHLLVAGATGGGKSVFVNTLISSLILKNNSDELKLVLIDVKRIELSPYKKVKHLLYPIATEPKEAVGILAELVEEMELRYKTLEETNSRGIDAYNKKYDYQMSRIVLVIDEYADLLMQAKEIEEYTVRLAQKARACGIYLVIATQKPTEKSISTTLKSNLPTRIAFATSCATDSRTILDENGAEELLGKGDMLIKTPKLRSLERLQGFFIDDKTIDSICEKNKDEVMFELRQEIDSFLKAPIQTKRNIFKDELTEKVIIKSIEESKISISWISAQFSIGTGRANKIFAEINDLKLIDQQGPANQPKKLIVNSVEEWEQFKLK